MDGWTHRHRSVSFQRLKEERGKSHRQRNADAHRNCSGFSLQQKEKSQKVHLKTRQIPLTQQQSQQKGTQQHFGSRFEIQVLGTAGTKERVVNECTGEGKKV